MQYFDFHTHVILKQLFNDSPNIDARISTNDVDGIPRICTDLPNIIETQIHQSQLADFKDEVIIGAALYGLESYLAEEVIPLRKYLKGSSQYKLSLQLLTDVAANKYTSFTDFTFKRTLECYLNSPGTFNILRKESFKSPLPTNKVNIFFVVEGCHSLVDSVNKVENGKGYPPAEILSNLDKLLQQVNILSVNPTHMQQSNLCNHAFGIQITRVDPFFPTGNGLTDDGRKVIQGLFDRKICVDLKHMSYKSRLDLMNEIAANKFNNTQPLLCTHAGFTGVSFVDWPKYIGLKKPMTDVFYLELVKSMHTENMPQRPGAPAFNLSTINLFNEEIVWIVKNGGVIGLSMDRRIIGYVSKHDEKPTGMNPQSDLIVDKEYFSKTEWNSLQIDDNSIGKKIDEDDCVTMTDLEQNTEDSIPARDEYFFDHILLHLKHFLQVCHDANIAITDAAKHITLGTDFDGLINPFINIPTVEFMSQLKKYIKMNFRFYLQTLTDSSQWVDELNLDQFVEDLFYNNGYNFVKSRFAL